VIDGPASADAIANEIMETPVRPGLAHVDLRRDRFRDAAIRRKSLSRAADHGAGAVLYHHGYRQPRLVLRGLCDRRGPGSFVVSIKDRDKFKVAIWAKIILEVAGQTPKHRTVPVAEKEPRVSCLIGEKIWQDRWGR